MKLNRNKMDDSSFRGKVHFTIEGKDSARIEAAEETLCAMECPFRIGGETITWGDYCDNCPCYEDGYGSGFWIATEDVEAFKAAWKIAKKVK